MNPYRRFQTLATYWYCRDKKCKSEGFGTAGQVEISALAHMERYGHEVRAKHTREIIYRPAEERLPDPAELAELKRALKGETK